MALRLTSTMTSKGQFTLPVEIRQALDLRPGDELRFELTDDKQLRVAPRRRRSIRQLRATLPPLTLERELTQADIDEAVAGAMEEQEARIRSGR